MTLFGYVLFTLLSISLFFKFKYTFTLLIMSCIFMTTTVINFSGKIVQPYLLCSMFVVLRTMIRPRTQITSGNTFRILFFFCVYALIVTLLCPQIFEGIKVLDKGIDSSIESGGMALKLGMSNITQVGYLLLNCTTLYCIWRQRITVGQKDIEQAFLLTVLIAVVLGLWEFSSKTVGVYFPSDFIFNGAQEGWLYMSSVYGYLRLSSVFGESSFCGAFMASAFWGIIAMTDGKWNWRYITLLAGVFLCLVLGISGTGVVAFCFGGLTYSIFIKRLRFKFIVMGTIYVLIMCIVVNTLGYWDVISTMLLEKSEGSGAIRSAAVTHSIELFFDTYMLGCGMGSTRSSSFIADLLASVGLIGTFTFAMFYYKFVKARYEYKFFFLYLMTMLAAQTVAIPDFSFCSFWLMMFIGAALNTDILNAHKYGYIQGSTSN